MDDFETLKTRADLELNDDENFEYNDIRGILLTTNNPNVINYIFSNLRGITRFEFMDDLSKNNKLNTITITNIYFQLHNAYFRNWDDIGLIDDIPMLDIIINNIITYTKCGVNFKLLTIMFKIFNNLLSNNIEDLNKYYCFESRDSRVITSNCNDRFRMFNLIVYVEYFIPDDNIDLYFNIGTESIVNKYIILLLDKDLNCDIYKCLQVLLNHDPNLHIFYFIKIFQMKSIASIDLIDLLLTYDIDDILNTQLDLLLDLQNTNTYLDILDRDNNTLLFKFEKLNNGRLEYILK